MEPDAVVFELTNALCPYARYETSFRQMMPSGMMLEEIDDEHLLDILRLS